MPIGEPTMPTPEETRKGERAMTEDQRILSEERQALIFEQKDKPNVFIDLVESLRNDAKKIRKMAVEQKRALLIDFLEKLIEIPNYYANNDLLILRNEILDTLLPNYQIRAPWKNEDVESVGYAMEGYYDSPAAFSKSPLVGGENQDLGVVGDLNFYPEWSKYHEGQTLFVLPGIMFEDLGAKYGFEEDRYQWIEVQSDRKPNSMDQLTWEQYKKDFQDRENRYQKMIKEHTLRTAKLAALFLGADFLSERGEDLDEEYQESTAGYDIWRKRERR